MNPNNKNVYSACTRKKNVYPIIRNLKCHVAVLLCTVNITVTQWNSLHNPFPNGGVWYSRTYAYAFSVHTHSDPSEIRKEIYCVIRLIFFHRHHCVLTNEIQPQQYNKNTYYNIRKPVVSCPRARCKSARGLSAVSALLFAARGGVWA